MMKKLPVPPPYKPSVYGGECTKEDPVAHSISCRPRHIKVLGVLLMLLVSFTSLHAQRLMEKLDRGVVAVRTNPSEVFISWRVLGTDPADIAFNLYRGETKLNDAPITGATNFTDNTSTNASYSVRPILAGTEQAASAPATA